MWKKVWETEKIAYGGDYNPEQWPEETWEEDMRLLKLAHIDTLTLNVFSWAALQPSEDEYQFEKLDKIMELAKRNHMNVCLATSTAAHPAWMARKYPDILRTDFYGIKRKFGARHNSCPNSPTYRKYSVRLAEKLAERYQNYDNIIGWHIANEYGGECYCENCEKAFRVWLKKRYGTLEELNRVWNTSFWGHTIYDWEDIVLPDHRTEHFTEDLTTAQTISIDYRRFNSDSILDCFRMEYEAVKKYTPDIPVTTNLMEGAYKALDYRKWGKYMDFISWDNYPSNEDSVSKIAFSHDLMRSIGDGKPFVLMEQTPSAQNWQPVNSLKRPGVMRLWSYQAVAHGADAVLFFQLKRSIGSCEKYHGAVIDHAGHEHTRVFREVAELGRELDGLGGEILSASGAAEAAIMFDWENWWAVEYSAGPSVYLKYLDEIMKYYTALHEMNIAVDIVGQEKNLSGYKVVIAPVLYMTKPGVDERIRKFVQEGGTFVTTFFSGYVDENDLVVIGGYPGRLRDILGIWVEEIDALPETKKNSFVYGGNTYSAEMLCDIMHLEGAKALAEYQEDFYAGTPVVTCNFFGEGQAYYVGTRSEEAFYKKLMREICEKQQVCPAAETPSGVEAVERFRDSEHYLFLLNHKEAGEKVLVSRDCVELLTGKSYQEKEQLELDAKGVAILKWIEE